MTFLAGVPAIGWVYIVLVTPGKFFTGNTIPVAVVFLTTLFPILLTVSGDVRACWRSELLFHLRQMDVGKLRLAGALARLSLPGALRAIRLSLLLAWSLVLLAEGSGVGRENLGTQMAYFTGNGSATFKELLAGVLWISLLAVLFAYTLRAFEAIARRFYATQ